jgi:SAM-dependent methyltransferase
MGMARAREVDWYDEPEAYDIVFDADTRSEARFLIEVLHRYGPRSTRARRRILEPACGSGRLVSALARLGHAVTGFDRNEAMLAYARKRLARRGLRAHVMQGDMARFQLTRKFELAHCLVSTFKYLLDEQSARSHLECVARSLMRGGVYVLGFHLTDYERTRASRERWIATRGGTRVTCVTNVEPPNRVRRLEEVRTRLRIERGGRAARTETRWRFRTYDARQFERLLSSVPSLERVALYDFHYEVDRPRHSADDGIGDCVFVLRRR